MANQQTFSKIYNHTDQAVGWCRSSQNDQSSLSTLICFLSSVVINWLYISPLLCRYQWRLLNLQLIITDTSDRFLQIWISQSPPMWQSVSCSGCGRESSTKIAHDSLNGVCRCKSLTTQTSSPGHGETPRSRRKPCAAIGRTFFCFLWMLTLYKMLECLGNFAIFSLVPITVLPIISCSSVKKVKRRRRSSFLECTLKLLAWLSFAVVCFCLIW